MCAAVRARGGDQSEAGVLAVLLEGEAHRHEPGRGDPDVRLGGSDDLVQASLVRERARVHSGLARERRDEVPVPPLALQDLQDLVQADRLLHELLQRRAGDDRRPLTVDRHVLGAELDQIVLERRLVLQVLLLAPPLHAVQRRLGDEEMTLIDDLLIVPVEEREQQGADVSAVDVGVGEDHDAVVADLGDVELALVLADTHPRADGGDERLDLGVLQHLVDAGALDVEDLAAQREDRLRPRVAGVLCRPTS